MHMHEKNGAFVVQDTSTCHVPFCLWIHLCASSGTDTAHTQVLRTFTLFAVMHILKIERHVTGLCILTENVACCLARDSTTFHPSIHLSSLIFFD